METVPQFCLSSITKFENMKDVCNYEKNEKH